MKREIIPRHGAGNMGRNKQHAAARRRANYEPQFMSMDASGTNLNSLNSRVSLVSVAFKLT